MKRKSIKQLTEVEVRSELLATRLTESEYKAFVKLCEKKGVTKSRYLRHIINDTVRRG